MLEGVGHPSTGIAIPKTTNSQVYLPTHGISHTTQYSLQMTYPPLAPQREPTIVRVMTCILVDVFRWSSHISRQCF
jgi:hypothetical protein